MGEKLHTIIKALEQRMDSGVLQELNITRLHMLIGDELVKQSLKLPDDNAYIELIEKAMQNYFQKNMFEEENSQDDSDQKNIENTNDAGVQPPDNAQNALLQAPINFKLNIKKNEDNHQALINQIPVIFSPLSVRNILTATIMDNLPYSLNEEEPVEAAFKSLEETSFVKTIQMLTDVFHHLENPVSVNQKIRLGLIIYRLLGYGDFKMEEDSVWKISLFYTDPELPDIDYFSLGFVRGIFVAADVDLYNKLGFAIANTLESSIITGSEI